MVLTLVEKGFSASNKMNNTNPDFRFVMHGKKLSISSKIINYSKKKFITKHGSDKTRAPNVSMH